MDTCVNATTMERPLLHLNLTCWRFNAASPTHTMNNIILFLYYIDIKFVLNYLPSLFT